MSIVKFCDKCGKKIDLCDTRNVTLSVKTTFSNATEFDLCPNCGDLLTTWLMDNEIKEEVWTKTTIE